MGGSSSSLNLLPKEVDGEDSHKDPQQRLGSSHGKRSRSEDEHEHPVKTQRLDIALSIPGLDRQATFTAPKSMNDLPVELLHEVFKSLPDLRALHSFILTCKHFHEVFATDEDKILTSVLYNDIGRDVMVDYLELDDLVQRHGISPTIPSSERVQMLALGAIERRRQKRIPDALPRITIAYIAIQAGLVRQTLEILLEEVLLVPPDYKAPHAQAFHMDLAHQHYASNKHHKHFNEFTCKMPLDNQESARFLRGLHRLHICRMLSTHGWIGRPDLSNAALLLSMEGSDNPAAVPDKRAINRSIAQVAKTDEFSCSCNPRWTIAMKAFLRSLTPWQQEEVLACAKLYARGYAHLINKKSRWWHRREYPYTLVLDHFSDFVSKHKHQNEEIAWRVVSERERTIGAPFNLWLSLNHHYWTLPFSNGVFPMKPLREFLSRMRPPWNITADPLSVSIFTTSDGFVPYEGGFEDAPPLYRAMIDLVHRPGWKERRLMDEARFIDGCWAMWSNPIRLKAMPQWALLTEYLQANGFITH